MPENDNEELEDLLDELDNNQEPVDAPEPEEIPVQEAPKPAKKDKKVTPVVAPAAPPTAEPQNPQVEVITGMLQKFETAYQKITSSIEQDRQQLNQFIDLYASKVQSEDPRQPFVEGLVTLQSIKATATSNSIKLLDSIAKTMAAAKAGLNTGPTQMKGNSELTQLLSSSEFDENAP